jgi:hypothetical protein
VNDRQKEIPEPDGARPCPQQVFDAFLPRILSHDPCCRCGRALGLAALIGTACMSPRSSPHHQPIDNHGATSVYRAHHPSSKTPERLAIHNSHHPFIRTTLHFCPILFFLHCYSHEYRVHTKESPHIRISSFSVPRSNHFNPQCLPRRRNPPLRLPSSPQLPLRLRIWSRRARQARRKPPNLSPVPQKRLPPVQRKRLPPVQQKRSRVGAAHR